jgi:hypothetical protein
LNNRCASSRKKHELGLGGIADFRQLFKQLRQHPQQEGRVELRALHQPVRHQDVDHPPAGAIGAREILQRQRRLPEKLRATLIFKHQKLTLDRPHSCFRDISIFRGQLGGVVGDER